MKYSCFISYRRIEGYAPLIRNLKRIIETEMYAVTNKNRAFFDDDTIRYGEEFDNAIYDGITHSFFFFSIWYNHYLHIDNTWCAKELFHAIEVEKAIKETLPEEDRNNFFFIIPILFLGGFDDLPLCLSNKKAFNISHLRYAIEANKSSIALDKFKKDIYTSINSFFKVIDKHKSHIELQQKLAQIQKPNDAALIQWIEIQKNRITQIESTKFPILQLTNEQ